MNTFEDDYETYFQEVYRLASMEFSESDIPSMIVDNKFNIIHKHHVSAEKDVIGGGYRVASVASGKTFSLAISCIQDDVSALIESQEAHIATVNERVFDGICR